ncbi:MAG: hypothetical protein JWN04_3089 [Myxococcaceae bacterium]|nr:hypothetical protein [Myxococcaceae bacterium]
MSDSQRAKIQALLGGEQSSARSELVALAFDAITSEPVAGLVDREAAIAAIYSGLTEANAQRIAERHVLPAFERIASTLDGKHDRLRDLLSDRADKQLTAIVASGKGPRFQWMQRAIDPDDVRQLIAPIIQQLLLQFTAKLPIPGVGGGSSSAGSSGGGGGGSGGIGGLVGRIGKQVQRSAGQLADVGRSMMGGVIKDFSQTATSEFRSALKDRLKSPEGQLIVERMRDRFLTHLLGAKADHVVKDFMHLPRPEIAHMVALVIDHLRDNPLFRSVLEAEFAAVLDELGQKSGRALLEELGVFESTRAQVLKAVDPGVKALVSSEAFGGWLERLLASTADG